MVEAWQGKGVRSKPAPKASEDDVAILHATMSADQSFQMDKFLSEQTGKRYDYRGVLRFISRSKVRSNDRWFCSELVVSAFQAVGINLLARIESGKVSPQLLWHSPLLEKQEQERDCNHLRDATEKVDETRCPVEKQIVKP